MSKDWAEKVILYKEALNSLVTGTKPRTDRDEKIHDASHNIHVGTKVHKGLNHPDMKKRDIHVGTKVHKGLNHPDMKKRVEQIRSSIHGEDYGAGFDGTDELDDKYRKDTPGQSAVLKRIKKIVKEKYGVKRTHLKPRRTTGYTGVPGKNLKGKGNSQKAMSLGIKKVEHAKKDLEDN